MLLPLLLRLGTTAHAAEPPPRIDAPLDRVALGAAGVARVAGNVDHPVLPGAEVDLRLPSGASRFEGEPAIGEDANIVDDPSGACTSTDVASASSAAASGSGS